MKELLVPGSIAFFGLGLAVGITLLYGPPAVAKWARRWLVLLGVAYLFLSTPLGAELVSWPLVRRYAPIPDRAAARGADALVVLSVGAETYHANGQTVADLGKGTALNALEAARVYRLIEPSTVIVSGGFVEPNDTGPTPADTLGATLVTLGVPAASIEKEARSRTTREQALFAADLLRQRRVRRIVLVSEAHHMPRAMGAFRAVGLDPIPSIPASEVAWPGGRPNRFTPNLSALRASDWASYEHVARLYYWIRRWSR